MMFLGDRGEGSKVIKGLFGKVYVGFDFIYFT